MNQAPSFSDPHGFFYEYEDISVALSAIAPEYRTPLTEFLGCFSEFAPFRKKWNTSGGEGFVHCEGITIGLRDRMQFSFTLGNWTQGVDVMFYLHWPSERCQDGKMLIEVDIVNRAGGFRECDFLVLSDYYKDNGFDFDWSVDPERVVDDTRRVLLTAFKLLSNNLFDYVNKGESWPYLQVEILPETSPQELKDVIAALPNKLQRDANNRSLFYHVVRTGRAELVQVVLDEGFEITDEILSQVAGLKDVDEEVIIELLELLLANGGDVDSSPVLVRGEPASALEAAAIRNHVKVVRFLLRAGAKKIHPPSPYYGPNKKYSPEVQQLLISAISEYRMTAQI